METIPLSDLFQPPTTREAAMEVIATYQRWPANITSRKDAMTRLYALWWNTRDGVLIREATNYLAAARRVMLAWESVPDYTPKDQFLYELVRQRPDVRDDVLKIAGVWTNVDKTLPRPSPKQWSAFTASQQ
jgi:hypothetical protein